MSNYYVCDACKKPCDVTRKPGVGVWLSVCCGATVKVKR